VEAWRTALELDLRSRPVGNEEEATRRLEIGRAEKRLQRFAAARDELERSLELWPGRPLAHFQLGLTLLRLGDEAGAMAQLERVLAIEPNHFKALVRLSTLYSSALDPSLRDGQAAMDIALEAQRAAPPDLGSRLKALHALAAAHAERGWANPAIREAEMQEARALTNDAMQQALKANDMQAFRLAARLSRHYSSGRPLRRAAPR
jgi:tetratricopeptide (TPR) repeat protein